MHDKMAAKSKKYWPVGILLAMLVIVALFFDLSSFKVGKRFEPADISYIHITKYVSRSPNEEFEGGEEILFEGMFDDKNEEDIHDIYDIISPYQFRRVFFSSSVEAHSGESTGILVTISYMKHGQKKDLVLLIPNFPNQFPFATGSDGTAYFENAEYVIGGRQQAKLYNALDAFIENRPETNGLTSE